MQRLAARVKQAFPRTGANPRLEVMGRRTDPPPLGTQDFLEAYDASPWVRAIAGRVSQSVGETVWLGARTDSDRPVPQNHLMLRTLRRPNGLMSGSSLIRVTQLCIDLTGDSFWLLERNGFGAPSKYWPIPPHWVDELPSGGSPYYRIQWQTWDARIPESEVIWIHDPSPVNPYARGSGILKALSDEVTGDEFASKHANTLFFNKATPEFVVMDSEAGDEEIEVHERHWNSRLRGLYRAFKPYFTNRNLEFWQPEQMNLENLTLVPLRKFQRDIQMQCWGLPPEQLGVVEKSNRATAEASDYIMESRLIRPRRKFLAEELSMKLAPQYDERLEIQFVDTTPRDREQSLKVFTANPVAFDMDDWRELAGLERLGGEFGKARLVPLQSYVTTDPLDNTQRPNQPGAAANADDEEGEEDDAADEGQEEDGAEDDDAEENEDVEEEDEES